MLILAATGIYFYCDKSSKSSCVRNPDKYKSALKVIFDNKTQIISLNKIPDDPKWQAQLITRSSIENLKKEKADFQEILKLWDKKLISEDYGISFLSGDWNSIDFDLPGEGNFLSYLPSDKFTFTCASGQIMRHERLEKNWYYVYYCPE